MKTSQKTQKSKEKLQNFISFQSNVQLNEELTSNYYQYVVLRYQIKDLYKLIEYHKSKCMVYGQQMLNDISEELIVLAKSKYETHLDSASASERKILRQLGQIEGLLLSLGLYVPKKGKHKRSKSKQSEQTNDGLIQDLIVKLSIFTAQESI